MEEGSWEIGKAEDRVDKKGRRETRGEKGDVRGQWERGEWRRRRDVNRWLTENGNSGNLLSLFFC
jgi:hypothetical protein